MGRRTRGTRRLALLGALAMVGACGKDLSVTTATLPPGDPHCPNGGTLLEVTNSEGSTQSQYLCNGSSGAQSASLEPPGGPAGSFTLVTRGGSGSSGPGGHGGDVTARMAAGSLGGHVKVFRTGLADASFITPSVNASELGPTPLTASSGTTVVAATSSVSCSGVPGGGYFTSADTPGPLFHCSSTGAAEQVTGISVGAGATLTFAAHACSGGVTDTACVVVRIAAAFRNAGTVALDASALPGRVPALSILPGSFYGEAGSSIRLSSGLLTIDASDQGGAVWNQGTLDVSGGAITGPGAHAGPGGVLTLAAGGGLVNTGTLALRGGDASGADSEGGAGGVAILHSREGAISQSGTVDASGGVGFAIGGAGGEIHLEMLQGTGSVRNKGDLLAAGGDTSSGCSSGCAGGGGGQVILSSLSGDLLHSARIDVHGGGGAGGPGGEGGVVSLTARTGLGPSGGSPQATGNLYASGDVDAHGGTGRSGGAGGAVEFVLDPRTAPRGQELILLGYASVDTRGGDGSTDGGGGGAYTLTNAASFVEGGLGAGGGVVNDADVDTSGGDGGQSGGSGGAVTLQSQIDNAGTVGYVEPANNHGALTLNGGSGLTVGGEGGQATLEGRTSVESAGPLRSLGGGTSSGSGGPGGRCALLSVAGSVTSGATIRVDGGPVTGGSAASMGGEGGAVQVQGLSVNSRVAFSAVGGAGGQGTGGAGGRVSLLATGEAVSNTATGFDLRGGTGVVGSGAPGLFFLDGQAVPSP